MELDELLQRIRNQQQLEAMAERPPHVTDSERTMQELRADNEFLRRMIVDLQRQLEESNAINKRNSEQLDRLYKMLDNSQEEKRQFLAIIEKLESQLAVSNKMMYGRKSVKGIGKVKESKGRDDDKDDFDGTPGSISVSVEAEAPADTSRQSSVTSRKGRTYKKLEADTKVFHKSDLNQLPEGSTVISKDIKKIFDQVSMVVEHDFEMVTYKTVSGKVETKYFPCKEDRESHIYNEAVPHTHITAGMLSQLAFDCQEMSTPVYREMSRILDQNMKTCRQTVQNWLVQGGRMLNNLIPALKQVALAEGENTNCDETWCRVKTARRYKKHYIWCLVNKAQKTVIFFYDEGSRGMNALKDFLGDSKIKSMQTDGYNVYMYLDKEKELLNIEHLCCWAHARQKFKLAYEQGSDERARYFLEQIGELYRLEKLYKSEKLTTVEIKERRNSAETNTIIANLACRLNDMLNIYDNLSSQMQKAVNYLKNFWKQLVAYRNDGNYSIDNNLAERSIRPMTVLRKNIMMYGSSKGAEISAIYHTIIETCKLSGISPRRYMEQYINAVNSGRKDYENLLPSTIGR